MIVAVQEARYLRDYTIWVKFTDSTEGELDLKGKLDGPIFKPLNDISNFKRFKVDPELDTITWYNGADLAPEYIYDKIKITA